MDFMKYFMLILDNEVVGELPNRGIYQQKDENEFAEKLYAILSSNPIVIATDSLIPEGYVWDGQNFNPPVEQYYDYTLARMEKEKRRTSADWCCTSMGFC